jgi:hypothetical protein
MLIINFTRDEQARAFELLSSNFFDNFYDPGNLLLSMCEHCTYILADLSTEHH